MRSVNTSMYRLLLGAAIAVAFSGNANAKNAKSSDPAATPVPAAKPADAKPVDGKAVGAKTGDEKVDISDLENKYWAPKDTDFSVVQNRTYTKEKRFFLSLQYGIPVNDQYSTGNLYGFTGNYFFSERHGIQVQYIRADEHPNQSVSDLATNFSSGVYPDHGRKNSSISVGYNFVPFYSKMSVMGKKIMYFDMAITPTLGNTMYTQMKKSGNSDQNGLTYGVDITQFFFFTNYIAARVDWKNSWYTQKVVHFQGNSGKYNEGDPALNRGIHDSSILLGLTFFY